ncbi:hypothetical protein FHP25_08710 [Vineibacter terrae]|uniref:Uncharacterized protein n=1 Tax=Vineibacter terrae TaxID=2586908 RepID=A0A5C8PSJ5_9HYPH|nr:hypothetical protein [Vineibacter terrae]TXL78259.1 hypothetical protein FHP25_08710 [Vineibacter terrae]
MHPDTRHHASRLDEEFQCDVLEIRYDVTKMAGYVFMADDTYCNADGVIDFFVRLDPAVRYIYTFMGDNEDTYYVKLAGSAWASYRPPHRLTRLSTVPGR